MFKISLVENPYIVGRPIYEQDLFFGREDLFQFIEDNLRKQAKVILLHGQRRIGKSSVLAQIPNFLQLEHFVFIPLSLEGKSQKSLSNILSELEDDIKDYLIHNFNINQVIFSSKQGIQDDAEFFAESFIPQVCDVMQDKNLVLLIDEFDVLGDHSKDTAMKHFFPYLQSILHKHKQLFIIPVVGRQLDDLSSLLGLFREAPNQEIGLLEKKSAIRLITEPAKNILEYEPESIQAILELTAGHPYFTQVLCFAIFSQAREEQKWRITREDVKRALDEAIVIGEGGLAWFWDGLPTFERIIFAAVSEAQRINLLRSDVTIQSPLQLLEEYGITPTEELKRASKSLIESNFLIEIENLESLMEKLPVYMVTIELVRHWLIKRHPLRQELEELKDSGFFSVNNVLNLSYNQITEIPDAIASLTILTELNLSYNQITEIPDAIASLTNLIELNLSNNQIIEIPDAIAKLTNLSKLDLYNNQIIEIPEEIADLTILRYLSLSGNQITEIPNAIAKLTNLRCLYLSHNQITEIPDAIANLTNLLYLYLRDNQIKEVPEAIVKLTNLQSLSLHSNQITKIEAIAKLSNLQSLNLCNNQITEIPDAITYLSNLTVLYLFNNQITEIPDAITYLSNLTELNLSKNQITKIPQAIANLTNLTELALSDNQITEIPQAIVNLTNLSRLDLRNNPIPIPVEILNDYNNPRKILDYYFRQRFEKLKPLNEGKLIVVGQGTVGKTALISQLIDSFWEEEGKTEGIKIRQWLIKARNTDVQVNVWDFGGQEIMHATHQFFLTERSLYLLVLNNREDERANQIDRWLKIIQSFGKDSPILIVGNWADQHPMDLDETGWQKKYPNIKGFYATACKDKVQGIPELRAAISTEIGNMDSVFVTLPQTYFNVKSQIEQLERQGKDYIPYTDYQTICIQQKISQQNEQRNLAQILHDLGIALNFADDDRSVIKDTYVLNPGWIVGGVYKILNDNLLITRDRGILATQELWRIFTLKNSSDTNRYATTKEHQFVIDMMLKFELCFQLDQQSAYLIPDLLPKVEPDTGNWEQSLSFELHYEVLPQSVMSRFIVKSRNLISKNMYWRTGVVLAKDGARAYIKADLDDGKIFIRIIGNPNTRRGLLSIIRNNFDAIHKTIAALPVKEHVPLPDLPTVTVSYKHLLTLETKGVIEFIPEDSDKSYNIRELLDGIETSSNHYKIDRKSQEMIIPRNKLFISYSHRDEEFLKEFQKHFTPYKWAEGFDVWDDGKIKSGTEWRQEINQALAAAKVAVLLVSPNFLASKFIHEKELPSFLDAAELEGLTIIWIPLSASAYKKTAIEKYQSAHPPNRPLKTLNEGARDQAWVDICEKIEEAMKKS